MFATDRVHREHGHFHPARIQRAITANYRRLSLLLRPGGIRDGRPIRPIVRSHRCPSQMRCRPNSLKHADRAWPAVEVGVLGGLEAAFIHVEVSRSVPYRRGPARIRLRIGAVAWMPRRVHSVHQVLNEVIDEPRGDSVDDVK